MLNNNIDDYVAYFKQLATEHKQIRSFCHGTVSRLIAQSRSDIEYPALWLETPNTRINENDAEEVTAGRYGAFLVICNAPDKTPEQEDEIWTLTEEITIDLMSRLKRDRKKRLFHGKLNMTMDPVSTLLVDNDYGWRVELQMDKSLDLCYKPEKWEEPE